MKQKRSVCILIICCIIVFYVCIISFSNAYISYAESGTALTVEDYTNSDELLLPTGELSSDDIEDFALSVKSSTSATEIEN